MAPSLLCLFEPLSSLCLTLPLPLPTHSEVQIPVVTYRLSIPFEAAAKQSCHCLGDCLATDWSFWFKPDVLPPPDPTQMSLMPLIF